MRLIMCLNDGYGYELTCTGPDPALKAVTGNGSTRKLFER
jgi:hypothetical protein